MGSNNTRTQLTQVTEKEQDTLKNNFKKYLKRLDLISCNFLPKTNGVCHI